MAQTPTYAPPYEVENNCLYLVIQGKHGQIRQRLCNFVPRIVREITLDDGITPTTYVTLAGTHESGRELPEITIEAKEFAKFGWTTERWSMDCILAVGKNVKEHVRVAIQTTAAAAERTTIYAVTGWKQINGKWHYLMPGDVAYTVQLPNKMHGYHMERIYTEADIASVGCMLEHLAAPAEITYPLLSLVFLSPLNHFLKMAGCEPKFVLSLLGKTGSGKSSMAALALSFYGKFTATDMPASFQDTPNSILTSTFMVKDALLVIDDLHPSTRVEEGPMTAKAQSIMRCYGDRNGKGRLNADCTHRAAKPPQGNAIITAEFAPDVGESGTARYFALELKRADMDWEVLSSLQQLASNGTLNRCMFAFIEWITETYLKDEQTLQQFLSVLQHYFVQRRNEFPRNSIRGHNRVAENVAWLQMGLHFFLLFLDAKLGYGVDYLEQVEQKYQKLLYALARRQADSIDQDKPTHIFIRKLFALLESEQAHLRNRNTLRNDVFFPGTCIGYRDEHRFYLYAEVIHRTVRKFCEDQGESFPITSRGLLKALAEEGLIETAQGQNTKSVSLEGKNRRVVCLDYKKAASIAGEGM